jgi:hypothetical protein
MGAATEQESDMAAGRFAPSFVLVSVVLVFAAGTAAAQVTTGTIAGTVKDTQGGVMPGATAVLVSESRSTRSAPVVTGETGDFLFVNVAPDTYTVEVAMPGFKTLSRTGVSVSPGDRLTVGTLTLDVGGATEEVNVRADVPLVQAQSGERSFTVPTASVQNLPISNRSFIALADLAPGVDGRTRVGGGGQTNITMDGVSTLDTGSNAPLLQMTVESIAEVKVLTSGYQAEYGRSSGLQITAVTKSGTNQFHGSLYDVERNSDWDANSRTNILNGDPKPESKERDWGYSIGGPVGKPGGNNRLFFFYSQEFAPRTAGNDVVRYRMPTALERMGDFSQTTDNNGSPYPYVRDPTLAGACGPASQAACFADGGVLGRIPQHRLDAVGTNILGMFPLPNIASVPEGQNYNFELTRPSESALAWEPAVRIDYQPTSSLRGSFKYLGWAQRNQVFNGSIPGFNNAQMQHPVVSTWTGSINYTLNATTFLEGTFGRSQNELAGCALAQNGTGPSFCTSAIPVGLTANRDNLGLGALPMLFPDAAIIPSNYYTYRALGMVDTPLWDGTRVLKPPTFSWGNRIANAPPNINWPAYLNINTTYDVSVSLTKVAGRHTVKVGFYNTHAYKGVALNPTAFGSINFANDTSNPLDSQFGFANAALGIFSAYQQSSAFAETSSVYRNTEAYAQDNWKVGSRLTLDYGVRFVSQVPQHDSRGQASNFLPDRWDPAAAPALYVAACPNGAPTCSAGQREAVDPTTGRSLGPNSSLAIGTLVPDTGNPTNGLFRQGHGIVDANYIWPALAVAPRLGAAYDLKGDQKMVVRGSLGLFFDRPNGSTVVNSVRNPPTSRDVTVRYSQLASLNTSGLSIQGAPQLFGTWEYEPDGLPSSTQWNVGIQMQLPWSSVVDVSYVGQHSWNTPVQVNPNAVDFGEAFRPENQDPTLTSATPGASALSTDLLRPYRGYGAMQQQWQVGWETYHSIQLSFSRRFRSGLSFGFNDTIALYDHANAAPRLQHTPDGGIAVRADQGAADELLGTTIGQVHLLRGNFVWDLPDLPKSGTLRRALAALANDWQLSGVWRAATGAPYTVGFNYQNGGSNVNLTGSPDYPARIRVVGDPGSGCSSDPYRQFAVDAFAGPLSNSLGLESGADYVRGCFLSTLDLAIARNIRLGGARQVQLRVDLFNAPNSATVTARNTTLNLPNPNTSAASAATNLPFDSAGQLIDARSRPRGAGVGVATGYQEPRSVQVQLRFSF